MKCIMPNCDRNYKPEFEEDGPDKCEECRQKSAEIAFKLDIQFGERKRNEAPMQETSRIRQLFTEEEIRKGDLGKGSSKGINIRDLGIL